MKINDVFPRDSLPNLFKKKKLQKTKKVPKLKKSTYGVGGLNTPAESDSAGDAGGGAE